MNEDFSEHFIIIYNNYKNSRLALNFGMSKLALSKFLGVSQGKMQYWEKGSWPSAKDLEKLHEKLGFSYRWLVTGEGEPLGNDAPVPSTTEGISVEDIVALQTKVTELEAELHEADRLNRQLVTRLLVDGVGDKHDAKNTAGKAADGQ